MLRRFRLATKWTSFVICGNQQKMRIRSYYFASHCYLGKKKKNKAFDTSYNEWQNNISDMRQVVFVSWKSFLYICPMGCVAAQLCVAKQEKFVSSEWLRACRANWNPAHFFIIGSFFFVISLVIDFFPIWKKMRLLLTVMAVLYIVARSVKAAFRLLELLDTVWVTSTLLQLSYTTICAFLQCS